MADQLIQRSGLYRLPAQPAVLGIVCDQAALLQQPTNALGQPLYHRLQCARAGELAARNTGALDPSVTYTPSTTIM